MVNKKWIIKIITVQIIFTNEKIFNKLSREKNKNVTL